MELSARHALICAALTGWKGDSASPWQSPVPEETIIAWAASYRGSETGLDEAFVALAGEGLFDRVLYPIFSVPVYYCSYNDRFLDELPEDTEAILGNDPSHGLEELKRFWDSQYGLNDEEYGIGWRFWGLCDGQGSQSGGSAIGPCLGSGCSWFTSGAAQCNWELPFSDALRTGWPEMKLLRAHEYSGDVKPNVNKSLREWRGKVPDFPWPSDFPWPPTGHVLDD